MIVKGRMRKVLCGDASGLGLDFRGGDTSLFLGKNYVDAHTKMNT